MRFSQAPFRCSAVVFLLALALACSLFGALWEPHDDDLRTALFAVVLACISAATTILVTFRDNGEPPTQKGRTTE